MTTIIAGAAGARHFKQQLHHRLLPLVGDRQPPASPAQETQRLHQLRTGEADAWMQLLAEWSPPLYSYLTASLGEEAAAQQALQALFSQLVQQVMGEAPVANLPLLIMTLAYQQGRAVYRQERI
jgi:hypothetical protein